MPGDAFPLAFVNTRGEMNNFYCNTHIEKCGTDANCKGCKLDPNKTVLAYDEFREEVNYWNCDSCIYCKPNADIDGVESICKRLDHKHHCFAKAVFHSYDCGQRHGCVCADYEPKESNVWLHNHWQKEYLQEYANRIEKNATISLCLDQNWDVRYEVLKRDFVLNTFLDESGEYKWVRKCYYKQSRKSPIGYVYCNEYPDGHIEYGCSKWKGEEE